MKTAAPLRTSAMIASFADPGQRTTPAPFGHALVAAAQADDRIVGLTADLGKYTDMHIFAQAFPQRYFQMGMAEQLLFGAAAGMGWCPSRRPTRCSPPAAPTTSSASTSPSPA
jgi:transketolase